MTSHSHHDNVEKQFGSQASAYLTSAVHASGRDLQRLAVRLSSLPQARLLDMGCGAGHASFVAAQNVKEVVAYDLSSQMLDVVAHAANEKGFSNITRVMPKPCHLKMAFLTWLSADTPHITGMMSDGRCGK